MSDEFDKKIEAKADTTVDSGSVTSGSTAGIDYVPAHETGQIKSFIIHIVGGQHMCFLKMQNILEFNMPLQQ